MTSYFQAANQLASVFGPLLQAGDDSPAALACAEVNHAYLKPGWCNCPPSTRADVDHSVNEAYWRNPSTGSHGWLCLRCHRITQTG